MKNQECKNMSEVNTKLVKENKYLQAAKADLLRKIECKDSVLLEIKSKINCDECDYQASTSKELTDMKIVPLGSSGSILTSRVCVIFRPKSNIKPLAKPKIPQNN